MKPSLPAFQLKSGAEFLELIELPLTTIKLDWFREPCVADCQFALAKSETHLFFRAIVHKAPIENLDCVSGEFCEGLWKFDCAEFFISDQKGQSYQEFNIAPQGAWWNAEFEAYRRQTKAASDLGVKIYSKKNAKQWEVGFSVPLAKLSLKPERANVSFVLINADGQPQYVSFANFSVKDPDFHLVSEFPSIAWSTHEV